MRPLIVIRRTPNIDFMAWHKIGFAFSLLLTLSSIVLFLTVGLNYRLDFVGGRPIDAVDQRLRTLQRCGQKLDSLWLSYGRLLTRFRAPDRRADQVAATRW
jgi:preprotein translocase subunit SecF